MLNLTNEQIARLQRAISTGDIADVLSCLMMLFPHKHAGQFVRALVDVAREDKEHAEALYRAAIVLYDKFFPEEHRGGLSALCGLTKLLDDANDHHEIEHHLEEIYPLVIRAARAMGRLPADKLEKNGKTAALRVLEICELNQENEDA